MAQCRFHTKTNDEMCKRKALPGGDLCWQHESRRFKGISVVSIMAVMLAVIGLAADLTSLGFPGPITLMRRARESSFEMPPMFIRLVNSTDEDIIVSELADFSLLVGARVSLGTTIATGRMQLVPVAGLQAQNGSLTVPAKGDLPVAGNILNPAQYRDYLTNGNSDLELIIYRFGGGLIFGEHPFPFNQDYLEKYRLDIDVK